MKNISRKAFIFGMLGVVYDLISPTLTFGEESLTKRIIKAESRGNSFAYNRASQARGLMQITPIVRYEWNNFNQKKIRENDLFNPEINVKVGEWYLHKRIKNHYLPYYDLETHEHNLLASWNWGPVSHGKLGDAKENFKYLPKETRTFIQKVMNA